MIDRGETIDEFLEHINNRSSTTSGLTVEQRRCVLALYHVLTKASGERHISEPTRGAVRHHALELASVLPQPRHRGHGDFATDLFRLAERVVGEPL